MGIFSRLSDIVNSNLNALLDRAEDPDKMLRNIIQEMEDTMVEVRTQAARAIAHKKQIARQLMQCEEEKQSWQDKAELALNKEREDLAKAALIEKNKMLEHCQQLKRQVDFADEDIAKFNDDIAHLSNKLQDARSRQLKLSSRLEKVKTKRRVKDSTRTERLDKIISQLDQFEQKMDFMEAEVESHDLGKPQSLADEIMQLETNEKVDEELEALKKKLSRE